MTTIRTKYASPHDFRQPFGFRWSLLVMPAVLQQLMRHENIATTMQFYVGRNAKSASAAAREALRQKNGFANNFANNAPSADDSPKEKIS